LARSAESLREYKWHHLLLFFLVRSRLRKIMALFLGALISYSSLVFLSFSFFSAGIDLACGPKFLAVQGGERGGVGPENKLSSEESIAV
jgi:hypothetical protein